MNLLQGDSRHPARRYGIAMLLCGLCALLCLPLLAWLDLANIVMLFLLTVALTAAWLGQGPGIFAAILSVALFDFLFVEPRYSFAVHDGQYLVTFAVMLLVALLISHLSSLLRMQLDDSREREQRTRVLYECARSFAGAMTRGQIDEALQSCLSDSLHAKGIALYLPDAHEQLEFPRSSSREPPSLPEQLLIQFCYNTGQRQASAEFTTDDSRSVYLPLQGATRMRGVLVIDLPRARTAQTGHDGLLLEALSSLVATALERLHFVAVAQAAELGMQSERLRSTILSAISHDIRTPLTVLCGLADTLRITQPGLSAESGDLVESLRTHAFRLHLMVEKLLDMARLQSGKVTLRYEWQPLEEVIGASIHMLGSTLSSHTVRVAVPVDLPLLQFDALLMERVFGNLLENAAKYSPPNSEISVSADVQGSIVEVRVCNSCSSFPAGENGELLDLFSRGQQSFPAPGFGIGLSICRSIIEAHGGSIELTNSADVGACAIFTLPLGSPPTVAPENMPSGSQA
jgi:two-component system sensor histidine kinase KdpD